METKIIIKKINKADLSNEGKPWTWKVMVFPNNDSMFASYQILPALAMFGWASKKEARSQVDLMLKSMGLKSA